MIVIVTGMHRSGTSAMAGLLHSNGIVMGEPTDFYPPPAPENAKGFYENFRFRSINDKILAENRYWVKTCSPQTPDQIILSDECKDIMRHLIDEYNRRYPVWGFKDPRICLTWPAWQMLFSEHKIEPKVILMYRNFSEIAASMIARRNPGDFNRFKALAHQHYKNMMRHITKLSAIVRFTDLITETERIAEYLSVQLEYPITDLSFIDSKLVHHR